MKVVHLWASTSIAGGGGGIVMGRLHRALLAAGVDSVVLEDAVHRVAGSEPGVRSVPRWRVVDGGLRRVVSRTGLNDVHRLSTFALLRHPDVREADVLHVHGTHSGYLNYLALPLLTRGRPAVFTMHDMWAVTGHCAYSLDCERWRTGCGHCPYPWMIPHVRRDATALEWRLKRGAFARSRIAFTAPSAWLAGIAREAFPETVDVTRIPYGIDTEVYHPAPDREAARAALGIPTDARVLMFASVNLADWRKGGDLLRAALEALPAETRERLVVLLLGPRSEGLVPDGIRVVGLGTLTEDGPKAAAYAASDAFVLPTRADNDPLVVLESLACGTPVVSFRVGGVPEVVEPGVTGYLAEPEDARGLAAGIAELLGDDEGRGRMGRDGRARMLRERSIEQWVERHLALYERVMAGEPAPAAARA